MTKRILIDLFYDVISPYSYVGFEGLIRYKNIWPIDLRLRPFYFGMAVKNNPGAPLLVPSKINYSLKDMERAAKHLKLDFRVPSNFRETVLTKSSVKAQRALLVLNQERPELEINAAKGLWRRFFWEGKGIFEQSDVSEVGITDHDYILARSNSPEIKALFKKNTDDAINSGCFGAPWILVHTENGTEEFFGSDRLPYIADAIGQVYSGPNPSSL